jgi:hypothetical protein
MSNDLTLGLINTTLKPLQCNDSTLPKILANPESLPLSIPLSYDSHASHYKPYNSACPDLEYVNRSGCWLRGCVVCGQRFYARRPDRLYCSYPCQHTAAKHRLKLKRKLSREKKCVFCSCSFTAKSAKARFCSLKHRVAYFRLVQNLHNSKTVTTSSDSVEVNYRSGF